MSKHTPGPWIRIGSDIGSEKNGSIASLSIMSIVNMKSKERDANARLIAAAPDLLDALDHIQDAIQNFIEEGLRPTESVMRDWQADARSAIAKATGGEA